MKSRGRPVQILPGRAVGGAQSLYAQSKSCSEGRPSAPPLPVANPVQTGRDQSQYSLYCAPCLRGPTEGRPPQIRYRQSVRLGPAFRKGYGRRQPSAFMNSPGVQDIYEDYCQLAWQLIFLLLVSSRGICIICSGKPQIDDISREQHAPRPLEQGCEFFWIMLASRTNRMLATTAMQENHPVE